MGKARLKLTDVTLREFEAHVAECLSEANKALETKTRNTRILRNFDRGGFGVLFERLDEEKLRNHLMNLLQSDFQSAKGEIISAMNVSVLAVFDKYFEKRPPFGPAKKKAEFPDAFVMAALEDWCGQNKQELYIVSSDGDMEATCSAKGPLFHLKSMGEFVDLVLRDEDDETEFLAQFFVDNPLPIIQAITAEFEDRMMYLEDEDGDGEASVSEVDLGSAAVVSLEENEAVLELDATVSFSAHVSYQDRDLTWDYKSTDLDRTETVPVEVTIQFERGKHLDYQVTAVTVNNGEAIRIYVDEGAKTHWK